MPGFALIALMLVLLAALTVLSLAPALVAALSGRPRLSSALALAGLLMTTGPWLLAILFPGVLTQAFSNIATRITMFGTPAFALFGSLIVALIGRRTASAAKRSSTVPKTTTPLAPWLEEMRRERDQ